MSVESISERYMLFVIDSEDVGLNGGIRGCIIAVRVGWGVPADMLNVFESSYGGRGNAANGTTLPNLLQV